MERLSPYELMEQAEASPRHKETAAQKLDSITHCPACSKKMETAMVGDINTRVCLNCRVCLPTEDLKI